MKERGDRSVRLTAALEREIIASHAFTVSKLNTSDIAASTLLKYRFVVRKVRLIILSGAHVRSACDVSRAARQSQILIYADKYLPASKLSNKVTFDQTFLSKQPANV